MTTSIPGDLILCDDLVQSGFVLMASCVPERSSMSCTAVGYRTISAEQLATWLEKRESGGDSCEDVVIVDTRSLAQFNAGHVRDCIHICGNKLVKRRLQQGKINVEELLGDRAHLGAFAVLYGDIDDEFTDLLATKMTALFVETYRLAGEKLPYLPVFLSWLESTKNNGNNNRNRWID